jgi:hypothetical protein
LNERRFPLRRLVGTVALLFAVACVIPVPHVQVQTSPEEAAVRTNLVKLRQLIVMASSKLKSFSCGSHRCYPGLQVQSMLVAVQRRAEAAFPPEAASLRDSLSAAIAFESEQLGPPKPIGAFRRVLWPPPPNDTAYDADAVDSAWQKILATLDRLLSYPQLALTITVQSTPPAATIDLQVGENTQTHRGGPDTRTDNELANVWRGIYTATIRKPGFKDATSTVDLINDNRTRISCTLVKSSSPGESLCRTR